MKSIIIYGCTMFSSELYAILSSELGNDAVVAFTVNKEYKTTESFEGLPVYAFEDLTNYFNKEDIGILIAIGYNNLNKLRENIYLSCKNTGYKIYTFISKNALIYSNEIGEGSIIMPGSYVGPFCKLGLCNIIKFGVSLPHHVNIGNFNWIAGGTIFGGKAQVGNHCFIGLSSTIRNEIVIADETFIGAKSYMSSNTKVGSAYYGIPAKLVEDRTSQEIINRV